MTTITRENAEIKSFITGFLSDPAHDNQSSNSLLTNVFRIALASLEAEPVVYMWDSERKDIDAPGYYRTEHLVFAESSVKQWGGRVVPLYTAPPATVVPEEKPMPNPLSMYAVDAVAAIAEVRGWNACRAAMLHGAKPVSQTYKLNKLSGNSPVTPDGWVMVPKRLTAENGAKGALSGEFSETTFISCPECFGDDDCDTCDGSGRIEIKVPVTWTTIKSIWDKGIAYFAAEPPQEVNLG